MYGLVAWNQDKPGVIVFLLAPTIWRQEHAAYSLVGARPRGPDTDTVAIAPGTFGLDLWPVSSSVEMFLRG